ncbi:MAG: ABC transporter permease [Micrococcales bacterium]|nr:ABC transporter permease [Micrococcales bacterium]
MTAAIRSEYRKFFSTRLWWILLVCMAGYMALMTLLMVGMLHFATDEDSRQLAGVIDLGQLAYSMVNALGYVFPVLVGALAITQEFRHQTVTPTFLVEPRRGLVMAAKLVAAIPMGFAFALASVLTVAICGSGFLAIIGEPTGLGQASTWALIGRTLLAMTLWALVGVGVGTLIPNQVVVIVVVLAVSQMVEPMLRMLPILTGRSMPVLDFLPSASGDAIIGQSFYSLMAGGGSMGSLLPAWAGVLALIAWGLIPAGIGLFTSLRRDIT